MWTALESLNAWESVTAIRGKGDSSVSILQKKPLSYRVRPSFADNPVLLVMEWRESDKYVCQIIVNTVGTYHAFIHTFCTSPPFCTFCSFTSLLAHSFPHCTQDQGSPPLTTSIGFTVSVAQAVVTNPAPFFVQTHYSVDVDEGDYSTTVSQVCGELHYGMHWVSLSLPYFSIMVNPI